ncbi:WD-40 repeat protein [Reticulomyxa filosa]|uniref:WD-40 repeat protein n=1 Tax=Reticulomyxa filosa TaxID=46433 RepID=X6MU80_RETFI|nr:WD-40 repeat protein [Reticulomyxa filosa]|eukprot:ETO16992.1 WD-40 repeat protein [Reticulomyxa filosa]
MIKQLFNGHSSYIYCVKFSQYYHYNNNRNVICSSSNDKTIRFWDVKDNKQLQIFKEHNSGICSIKFSLFNSGQYLCSGSYDKTIRLWDIQKYKSLHVFKGHTDTVWCVDISSFQNNNNNFINGNGYTICSGSWDKTIRIWDIETTKQFILFKGHNDWIRSVKYGSKELRNLIISGSQDKNICLWDIRSGRQVQIFYGHKSSINDVEYSPFIVNNIEIGNISNVICSCSWDNTIRFWDIRSNKNELYRMTGEDDGIFCIHFFQKMKKNEIKSDHYSDCGINMCYGSNKGFIHIWG